MNLATQLSTLNSQLWRKAGGFTLVELLVTAAIVTLLIGTGVPAFRRFGRVTELDLAADQVKAAILDTRALALNPRAEKAQSVSSYGIAFASGSGQYQVFEGATKVSEGELPTTVTVTSQPVELRFSVTKPGTIESPATNPIQIQLSHSQLDATVTRTLSVNRETSVITIQR